MDTGTVIATAIAVGVPLLTLAAAWGALGARLRGLEDKAATIEPLRQQMTAVDVRATESAKSQGGRLGIVEDKVSKLEGRFDGFEKGFASGRRSRTNAQGHPVPEKGGG